MEYRKIGTSGLNVSALSLGSWLTYGTAVDQSKTDQIIQTAYENGIISYDTANCYNRGGAETALGRAVASIPRERLVISTKLFFGMGDGPNQKGCSRKAVLEQADASLKRLGMDYVDILYFHRFDTETPLEESLRAMNDLIARGKVLYYGTSEWSAVQICEALAVCERLGLQKPIVNQPKFSLLCRSVEPEILPFCRENGIGQIGFSPLAQGMLTGKYRKDQPIPDGSRAFGVQSASIRGEYFSDGNFDKLESFSVLSAECGIPMNQLALQWALGKPGVSSVIVGASAQEQLLDNLAALGGPLSTDIAAQLEEIFPL